MTASGELCERCGENVVALNDPDGFCRNCGIEITRILNDVEYWHRRALERKREQREQTA